MCALAGLSPTSNRCGQRHGCTHHPLPHQLYGCLDECRCQHVRLYAIAAFACVFCGDGFVCARLHVYSAVTMSCLCACLLERVLVDSIHVTSSWNIFSMVMLMYPRIAGIDNCAGVLCQCARSLYIFDVLILCLHVNTSCAV